MSISRIHRLLRLITLLQGDSPRPLRALIEELGVSRRTLFRDLKMLELAGIPCFHESKAGYRIARTFYLPPVNLNVSETLGLMLLGKQAAAQRQRPMHTQALSAIYKLIATVPEPIRTACGEMMANVSVDPGTRSVGDAEIRFFATMQRCVDEGRVCRVLYKSPVEPQCQYELEPHALHFSGHGWYVFARTDQHDGEIRTFKLARCIQVTPLDRTFRRSPKFRIDEKIGQAWRFIPEGTLYQIELEFSQLVAANVSEVRWHASQQHTILPDGRCRMTFTVDGLGEIAWWLCGYAGEVKVLQPPALRARIRHMHEAALKHITGAEERIALAEIHRQSTHKKEPAAKKSTAPAKQ